MTNTMPATLNWYYFDEANIKLSFTNQGLSIPVYTKNSSMRIVATSKQPILQLTPSSFITHSTPDATDVTITRYHPTSDNGLSSSEMDTFYFDVSYTVASTVPSTEFNLSIPAGVLQTASGAKNAASNALVWRYLSGPPTCTMSSPQVDEDGKTDHFKITIMFVFDQTIEQGFSSDAFIKKGLPYRLSGIDVSSNVISIDAEVASDGIGRYSLEIPVGAVLDTVGNKNEESFTFKWQYSNRSPTCELTSPTLPTSKMTNKRHQQFYATSNR